MATPVPPESEGEAGAPLSDQHVQLPMPKSESDAEWDKMMVDAESAASQDEAFIQARQHVHQAPASFKAPPATSERLHPRREIEDQHEMTRLRTQVAAQAGLLQESVRGIRQRSASRTSQHSRTRSLSNSSMRGSRSLSKTRHTKSLRWQDEHERIDTPARSRSPTTEDYANDLEMMVIEELGIGNEFRMDREVQLPTNCVSSLGQEGMRCVQEKD